MEADQIKQRGKIIKNPANLSLLLGFGVIVLVGFGIALEAGGKGFSSDFSLISYLAAFTQHFPVVSFLMLIASVAGIALSFLAFVYRKGILLALAGLAVNILILLFSVYRIITLLFVVMMGPGV